MHLEPVLYLFEPKPHRSSTYCRARQKSLYHDTETKQSKSQGARIIATTSTVDRKMCIEDA
jgi:hypothetical protein